MNYYDENTPCLIILWIYLDSDPDSLHCMDNDIINYKLCLLPLFMYESISHWTEALVILWTLCGEFFYVVDQ